MKTLNVFCSSILLCCSAALADTHYVDIDNVTPSVPYTSWATAATNIQDAVDETVDGETVLVADGNYDLTTEILVKNDIIIKSANGPDFTIIGPSWCRSFNLGSNQCLISGFTISGGYEHLEGGGIYCYDTSPVISNCMFIGNRVHDSGGALHGGTAYDCTFVENSAFYDCGGIYGGISYNCTFSNNTALRGGGMSGGRASNCTFINNRGAHNGGGMDHGIASNCVFIGNTTDSYSFGGGMHRGVAYNCIFRNNLAGEGGGMYFGTAYNSTFSENSADRYGGGIAMVGAYNCILWNNTADIQGNDMSYSSAQNSCSYDLFHGVDGNITNAPLFIDPDNGNFHLRPNSPCINAGANIYVSSTTDLDGKPRIIGGIADMGAYESGTPESFITNFVVLNNQAVLHWTGVAQYDSIVKCSTDLANMPFTDLSAALPYPVNSYTDTVSNGKCFYRVDLVP